MPTVELPDFWVLFNPEGKAHASVLAVSNDGKINAATAESAWQQIHTLRRMRERLARNGWRMLPVNQADWSDFWFGRRKHPDFEESTA